MVGRASEQCQYHIAVLRWLPFLACAFQLVIALLSSPGCTVTRTAPRFDAHAVQQIAVYDCRTQAGTSTERFVKAIDTQPEVDGIAELLGRYQDGWTPLRVTEPVGMLRLDCFDASGRDPAQSPVAQFRITPSGVVTYIDGRPYSHDIAPADQQAICRLAKLEDSFFSEPRGDTGTGTLVSWSQEFMSPSKSSPAKRRSIDELLLFYPAKYPEGNWAPSDLRYQDVWFNAADGTRLHGWYCPCDQPRAIILIAHGNAGNIASRAPCLGYLQSRAQVASFMFDYRGYGRSEGKPTVQGILEDARAARAKLCELAGIRDADMVLMGESLGGAVAVQLAAESTPRGLILQSTFSSMKDVAAVHFPRLSWLVPADKLDSATQIARYHGPLLQSHGTADETIPLSSGQQLFDSANEPKEFVQIPGVGHNDWLTQQYLTHFDQFLARLPPANK